MSYCCELPNGKVSPIDWVTYERLKMYGWVHRILDANQAVLHKIKKGKK